MKKTLFAIAALAMLSTAGPAAALPEEPMEREPIPVYGYEECVPWVPIAPSPRGFSPRGPSPRDFGGVRERTLEPDFGEGWVLVKTPWGPMMCPLFGDDFAT